MKRFDCLSADCPILGYHLLEASAGTGKTFTIEHVFVRLLLEGSIPLEEILAVTFTKASTRDLKQRIQSHLISALLCIKKEKEIQNFAYLESWIGSKEAIFSLTNALKDFDRCQIFTIHSFCFRMLKEFAFEAGQLFSVEDPQATTKFARKRREELSRFWEGGITSDILCPEQLSSLLVKYSTFHELGSALFKCNKETSSSFRGWHEAFCAAIQKLHPNANPSDLIEDFACIRGNYKSVEGDLEDQIWNLAKSFENPQDPIPFRKLLQHAGSLFAFLHPKNRKVKGKIEKALHYPGLFDCIAENLGKIVEEASNRKNILSVLATSWKKWEEKWILQSGLWNPDEILKQMRSAIEMPSFLAKLKSRYKAVIIDEFQDTDLMQWEIFRKTFLEDQTLKALYLVGDPKQSIYRFRNADVYTYFAAKEFLGENNLYHLDTNYRSSKELLHSLNAIFSRNFLPLPKTNGNISYLPVQAGSSISSNLNDDKRSLHWIVGDANATFRESFLPFAVQEIQKIPQDFSIAILVKDRYEAQDALELLRELQIPCVTRSHRSLFDTFAFQSVRELLDVLTCPEDENLRSIVEAGPFKEEEKSFHYWRAVLEEGGLALFFSEFFKGRKLPFQNELTQVLEELFAWEQREGFSFEGWKRFLDSFEKMDPEEGSRLRMEETENAVQILTLHVSKGLEFDIVFALGLASSSPSDEEEDEVNAEKLRQLYVAMTRAKKRLYVPIKKDSEGKAPMDLFRRTVEKEEGQILSYLKRLAITHSISVAEISTPYYITISPKQKEESEEEIPNVFFKLEYSSRYVQSFTSLSRKKESKLQHGFVENLKCDNLPSHAMPGGKETGIIIHQIFETIFRSSDEVWREDEKVDKIVENELRYTPLFSWTSDIQAMIRRTLSQTLCDGERHFSLKDLMKDQVFPEMEFVYKMGSDFVKGFIDLIFIFSNKCYFIDWKTNILKSDSKEDLNDAMREHDYALQASIYKEAIRRHFEPKDSFDQWFGGAFYLFVRTESYVHLNP